MSDFEKFVISRWAYSVGEPIMSDSEYQVLLDTMKVLYPDNEYVNRTWSDDPCPVELLKLYGYEHLIQAVILTDKTESIPSIGDWFTLKNMCEDMCDEHTLSFKHDGWNIQASYYNGKLLRVQTRGRARDAMSAEALMSKIPDTIPQKGKYTVCMEATVSDANYARIKSVLGLKSQRGAVSSCLARVEYLPHVDVHAFSIIGDEQVLNPFPVLESWGYTTPQWVIVKSYEELLTAMKEFDGRRQAYGIPTDGLVLRGTVTRAIRLLGWTEDVHFSYVTGYDESYGLHRIGVKVMIYPIAMRNSTQRLVSVTNYQRVIDNNLRVGYPIAFRLASMSIADLDEEATRLLQMRYDGKYEEYRKMIEENEDISKELSISVTDDT